MNFKKIYLFFLFLLISCSTNQKKNLTAPTEENVDHILKSISKKSNNTYRSNSNLALTHDFLKAKLLMNSSNKESCSLFTSLSKNNFFPLKELAYLYSAEVCLFTQEEALMFLEDFSPSNYLKEKYIETAYALSKKHTLPHDEAKYAFELIKYRPLKKDQIELARVAIELAKVNNDDQLEKYQQKLLELSPMLSEEITQKNIFNIAKDFEQNRNFPKAQSLYLDMINGDYSISEKVKAYNAYRTSFKIARDLPGFLEKTYEMETFFSNLLKQSPKNKELQENWVEANINLARAVWTEHQNLKARELLEKVIKSKLGTENQLATIYWVYGSLHVESKENLEAIKKFEKALTYKASKLDLKENIQWAIAWNQYLLGQHAESVASIETFIQASKNHFFNNKLLFWKAKAKEKMGKRQEATAEFEALQSSDPFGYYGLISSMFTAKPILPIKKTSTNIDTTGEIELDWLIVLREDKLTESYLRQINSRFKSYNEREEAMKIYEKAKWYQGAMLQIGNFPVEKRNELTEKYIHVIYPSAYLDSYKTYTKKYNVSLALPLAITRQESSFNPNARSWADAFGLMQLIPEKASELAKRHHLKEYKNFNDLYSPDLNIQMGTALLAELSHQFKGKFAQSVASYNASSSAIRVWEKERFNGDYLEFIESIPYEETRNYIKLIFRNFITYQRVLSDKEFTIQQDFFDKNFNSQF